MKVEVFSSDRKSVSVLEINDSVWGGQFSSHSISLHNRYSRFLSRKRISNTKTRGEVSGGGRKPWAQKGTGRARQGSIRSPQWKKGGVAFGPSGEQNYQIKMNKLERENAFCSLLSKKVADQKIIFIDSISIEQFKTKIALQILANFSSDFKSRKTLVVVGKEELTNKVSSSFANLPKVSLTNSSHFRFLDVFNSYLILVTKSALVEITNRLSS